MITLALAQVDFPERLLYKDGMVENIGIRAVFPKAPEDQITLIQRLAADLELVEADFVPEPVPFSPNTKFESEEMKIRAFLRELFIKKQERFFRENPDKAPLLYKTIQWEWPPKIPEGEIEFRDGENDWLGGGNPAEIELAQPILEMLGKPDNSRGWDWIIVWNLGDMRHLRPTPGKYFGMPGGRFVLFPDEVEKLQESQIVTTSDRENFNADSLIEVYKELFTVDEDNWLIKVSALSAR